MKRLALTISAEPAWLRRPHHVVEWIPPKFLKQNNYEHLFCHFLPTYSPCETNTNNLTCAKFDNQIYNVVLNANG